MMKPTAYKFDDRDEAEANIKAAKQDKWARLVEHRYCIKYFVCILVGYGQ